jgi:hypothetical protein
MNDYRLNYLNDRYLAFALPAALRELVGRSCIRWFYADSGEEISDELDVRTGNAITCIIKFAHMSECWHVNTNEPSEFKSSGNDEVSKIRERRGILIKSVRDFMKQFKKAWGDERHSLYIGLRENIELPSSVPHRIDSWDWLGKFKFKPSRHPTRHTPMIECQSKGAALSITCQNTHVGSCIKMIQRPGWFNVEREKLSHASQQFCDALPAPHQALYRLGAHLSEVEWGSSWFKPGTDSHSIRSITRKLPTVLRKFIAPISFLFSRRVSTLITHLSRMFLLTDAYQTAFKIGSSLHKSLLRNTSPLFDLEFELRLLAYDLLKLTVVDSSQTLQIFNNVLNVMQRWHSHERKPFTTIDELKQLADKYDPPSDRFCFQSETDDRQRVDKTKSRPIWERLITSKEHGLQIILEGKSIPLSNRHQWIYLDLLIKAQGRVVSSNDVQNKIAGFRVSRVRNSLPQEVRRYVKTKSGMGSWLECKTPG